MPGDDIGQFIIFHIEHSVDSRNEHSLTRIRDQQVIDAFHRLSRGGVLNNGGTYQGPCECHEEGSGNAFVCYIRNEESKAVIWQVKHIVEISTHLPSSFPACGQFPIRKLRQRLGDESLLDLPRQLHFCFEAFAYDHLFLEKVILNGKRGLLCDASNDLQPARPET